MTNPARPVAPNTTVVAIANVEAVLILAHNGILGFLLFVFAFGSEFDEFDDDDCEDCDDCEKDDVFEKLRSI